LVCIKKGGKNKKIQGLRERGAWGDEKKTPDCLSQMVKKTGRKNKEEARLLLEIRGCKLLWEEDKQDSLHGER